jgi:hypothetical protein
MLKILQVLRLLRYWSKKFGKDLPDIWSNCSEKIGKIILKMEKITCYIWWNSNFCLGNLTRNHRGHRSWKEVALSLSTSRLSCLLGQKLATMGNLLSKFLCWPPSLPKPSRHLLHPVTRIGHSTELDYSVAPEPVMGPGHRLFTQDPSTVPFAAVYYSVPKRRHNLGNDRNSTLGMPSFAPRQSPEKLLRASFPSSETDGRSTKVRIPAPGHRATLCSTPEQVVQEVEPVPSNHLHLVHQYDSEARPQKGGQRRKKVGKRWTCRIVRTKTWMRRPLCLPWPPLLTAMMFPGLTALQEFWVWNKPP